MPARLAGFGSLLADLTVAAAGPLAADTPCQDHSAPLTVPSSAVSVSLTSLLGDVVITESSVVIPVTALCPPTVKVGAPGVTSNTGAGTWAVPAKSRALTWRYRRYSRIVIIAGITVPASTAQRMRYIAIGCSAPAASATTTATDAPSPARVIASSTWNPSEACRTSCTRDSSTHPNTTVVLPNVRVEGSPVTRRYVVAALGPHRRPASGPRTGRGWEVAVGLHRQLRSLPRTYWAPGTPCRQC